MKTHCKTSAFILCLAFAQVQLYAQAKRICVIGSSTAYGYFPSPSPAYPKDSGWVGKIKNYYQQYGNVDTVYNLARLSRDCYSAMPNSYTPPAGENNPDPSSNISRAVALTPKPDVILVNYPTNNYDRISNAAIVECMQVIWDSANANGIRCYIATSQPRSSFNSANRQKLRALRDTLMEVFGEYAIDFFTPLAEDATNKIQSCYNLGDDIHVNPDGHTELARQVIAKNLFASVLPVRIEYFNARSIQNKTLLTWKATCDKSCISNFTIERSINGKQLENAGAVRVTAETSNSSSYTFTDETNNTEGFYYRVTAGSTTGKKIYSPITYANAPIQHFSASAAYPSPSSGTVYVYVTLKNRQQLDVLVSEVSGKIMRNKKIDASGNLLYKEDIGSFAPGQYFIRFSNGVQQQLISFIKQ